MPKKSSCGPGRKKATLSMIVAVVGWSGLAARNGNG